MKNPEFIELANSLRGRLREVGIIADDENTKTLNNCKRLFDAIDYVLEERERVAKLSFTRSYISDASGIDRGTLRENPVYDKIISYYRDRETSPSVEKKDGGPTEASVLLEKYRREIADLEAKLSATDELNARLAYEQLRYEDEHRALELTRKRGEEIQTRCRELEQQVQRYKTAMQLMQPAGQS